LRRRAREIVGTSGAVEQPQYIRVAHIVVAMSTSPVCLRHRTYYDIAANRRSGPTTDINFSAVYRRNASLLAHNYLADYVFISIR
jgi:hypothetical protein